MIILVPLTDPLLVGALHQERPNVARSVSRLYFSAIVVNLPYLKNNNFKNKQDRIEQENVGCGENIKTKTLRHPVATGF